MYPGLSSTVTDDVREPSWVHRGWKFGATCIIAALFAPWFALTAPARKILLAIVLLDIPLQIDQNFGYLEDAAELGAIGGFSISLTTLALALLYLSWFFERIAHPDLPARLSIGLLLPLGPFVLVSTLSVVAAQNLELYSRGLFLLVQMFLVYLYLVGTVRTREDVCFVVKWLLIGLVSESVIIISSAAGAALALPGLQARMDAVEAVGEEFGLAGRFAGTLGSPILAAGYLELLLAPALAVLGTNLRGHYKTLALAGLSLGSVALVGTLSRGGWLAASLSLSAVYLLLWRRGKLSAAVPIVLLVLLSALALYFHEIIARRMTGDDLGSARARGPLMRMALEIIADRPALGVGVNNFTEALRRRTPEFGNEWLYTVHNRYLLVWAETGAIGLAAYLWFLLFTLRRGWQRWKRFDPLLSPLGLGFTAALLGQMLHMQVDVFSSRPQVQILFVVAALIDAMSRMNRPEPSLARPRPMRRPTPVRPRPVTTYP
jgi:O-antigen ligase